MTWELEVDVELDPAEPRFERLMTEFVAPFTGRLNHVEINVRGVDWSAPVLASERIAGGAEWMDVFDRMWRTNVPDNGVLCANLRLDYDWDHSGWGGPFPRPYLCRFAPGHPGAGGRKRRDVVIGFGNRFGYRDDGAPLGDRRLTDDTLRKTVIAICNAVEPISLEVLCEQEASFPISHHVVYHRDPSCFVDDVADIVQITLHGGEGYTDGRKTYKSLKSDVDGKSMMLAYRTGESRDMIKRFLIAKSERAARTQIARAEAAAFIDDSLTSLTEVEFFYTEHGLGIAGTPLLDTYVEEFYIQLIDRMYPREGEPAA